VCVSLLIVVLAVVWTKVLGDGSADAVRDGLQEVTAVRVLELVALLVVLGLTGTIAVQLGVRAPFVEAIRRLRAPTVPPLVTLTAIVALAATFRAVLGYATTIPTVLGDELVYTDLAKSIALHGEPLLRGDLALGYSVFQPAVMSPAYAIASNGATAVEAIKVVNAIAMAATAIPAYLLARRILPSGWSLTVAALSVAAPWTAYAAFPMTESISYLAFTVLALALAMTLERPTARRQIALLTLLAVAVATRPQALVLAVSVVAAVVFDGLLAHRLRDRLRELRVTLGAIVAAVVVGAVLSAAGVPIPTGSYSVLYRSLTSVFGIAKWAIWTAGSFELALGGVALAAVPVALARLLRRDAMPAERAFGVTAATFTVGVLASVALLSASPYGLRVLHERSLFYVTPLVLTAFAYWLATGLERPRTISAAAAVVALALPLTVPRRLLLFDTNNFDVPSSSFYRALDDHVPGVPLLVLVAGLTVAAVGTLLLARRVVFPLFSVVVAFLAITAAVDYATPQITPAQARALAWVDRALPAGATATIVHMGFTRLSVPCAETAEYEQQGLVVWTEYFNTRTDRLYHVGAPVNRDGLASPELTFGSGGSLLLNGQPVYAPYVVIDSRQPVAGTPIARFDLPKLESSFQNGASLTLWRALEPLRLPAPPNPLPPRSDGRGC
jgi:hypothetical protein